ncbi:hypothetical protein QTO34_008520 [Cnephaeus nilssonii]|uniref:Peptidase A2 domain-containing protein n=1 Tax=Cnephaeus nilssonii TaxID=3371016 RepID=A0AA40LTY1_CNENI|nr:hypothetical protein QTO34_008520 [Eptesicus nilssonii]
MGPATGHRHLDLLNGGYATRSPAPSLLRPNRGHSGDGSELKQGRCQCCSMNRGAGWTDWKNPEKLAGAALMNTCSLSPESEPRVTLQVGGKPVSFLVDTGAAYSVLTEPMGPVTSKKTSVQGATGQIACFP